jgi:hypothetical protein
VGRELVVARRHPSAEHFAQPQKQAQSQSEFAHVKNVGALQPRVNLARDYQDLADGGKHHWDLHVLANFF